MELTFTYIAVIQHYIYDEQGRPAHTIRHAATEHCELCDKIPHIEIRERRDFKAEESEKGLHRPFEKKKPY